MTDIHPAAALLAAAGLLVLASEIRDVETMTR